MTIHAHAGALDGSAPFGLVLGAGLRLELGDRADIDPAGDRARFWEGGGMA